jgi:methylglutamate dehydrogenase subunit D
MADAVSALAGHLMPGQYGISRRNSGVLMRERVGRDLIQVAHWPGSAEVFNAKLATLFSFPVPRSTRSVGESDEITIFRVAPDKLWIVAPASQNLYRKVSALLVPSEGVVTDLRHARTVLRISGASTRDLLARHLAIDLDHRAFPIGSFASSPIHGVGCLTHYVHELAGDPVFDLYLPRTFALALFEGLCETAASFGYVIEA